MKAKNRIFILLATLLMVACSQTQRAAITDFTEVLYTPIHASGFAIHGTEKNLKKNSDSQESTSQNDDFTSGGSSLVTVYNPWQGASDVQQQLLLLRGEDKAPSSFQGQVVHAPCQRIVTMSSSHIAMFDAIGEAERIVGVSGIDYISSPVIQKAYTQGKVKDVGFDTNLDYELLAALRPDLMLLYGVTGENSVITGKLRELGIPYIYIGDYVEESPLGKAEWMVLMAELCDKRMKGESTFEGVASRYLHLKEQIANTPSEKRPKVMLNTPYQDNWFMPSTRSYMVRLVEDAGGEYIYPQNQTTRSESIDLEKAYLLAQQADVWLNTGMCSTLEELKAQNPKFKNVPAIKNHRAWNNNARQTPKGGSDFWESGVVRPDVVLQDLHNLFSQNGEPCFYYQQLN